MRRSATPLEAMLVQTASRRQQVAESHLRLKELQLQLLKIACYGLSSLPAEVGSLAQSLGV